MKSFLTLFLLCFTAVLHAVPPVVFSILPTSGTTAGGTTVTILGTAFDLSTAVTFGGVAVASFTVESNHIITATTPAHAAGTVSVDVTNPSGTSAANTLYTYFAPTVQIGPPFAEFVDPNPAAGNQFGATVVALNTGNVVVTAPYDDAGGTDAGAVYLFNGATGALISTLTGSTANDRVGGGGVRVLGNGNYLVHSGNWNNGAATNAGAVTWGSGTAGVSGAVSAANSLVGSTANDSLGNAGVTILRNGNYVVASYQWDNGAVVDAGAATWGSGTAGVSGAVSASNSLIGSTANDYVGIGVRALSNGNYVVNSSNWDNGAVVDAGAVTWGSGTTGVVGAVSSSNSLVGSTASDQVGYSSTMALSNGNYVVNSPYWDKGAVADAGAVTWVNGTSGMVGAVSSSNSLVGSTASDQVGRSGVTPLTNGNYVVASYQWDNGAVVDAGAATWGSGTSGVSGAVSSINSLVGSTANDNVGGGGVYTLSNGNYVVRSTNWDNGAAINAGAATWGSGTAGVTGVVSSINSLVGSTANDNVGNVLVPLTNGSYVVHSSIWDNGAVSNAGAATWGSGTTGVSGVVSSSNSLVGSTASDNVGGGGVTALSNGNYVVRSQNWDNGAAINAGAATWGSGTTGVSGAVSSSNSLVGSTTGDTVGSSPVTALSNGNYVVGSPNWDNGAVFNAGASTWGSGASGVSGVVSSSNSLVGSAGNDQVGGSVTALSNGNYVVRSGFWNSGAANAVGALTWGSGTTGVSGAVSSSNSLVGSTASDQVGGSVTALSNGNYVVYSSFWDNGAAANVGAATWGSGTTGVSGAVSSSNSVLGQLASAGLQLANPDDVNGTFFAVFLTEGGGKVRLGSQNDGLGPPPAPTVTSLDITSGSTAGGTSVTLTGTAFTGATGVTFGGVAVASFMVVNDTTITAVTAAGSAGSSSVVVTTAGGSNAANTLYTFGNTAPVITSNGGGGTAGINVAENTTAVTTVTATDSEVPATQSLTFTKSGADAALFTLNSSSGALSFTTAPNFEAPADAGANNVYDVTVTVTDDGTGLLTDTQALSVTVTDVNEAPSIAGDSVQLAYETVNPTRSGSNIVYSVNNAAALAGATFSRVRYRMELTVAGTPRYAETTFDA
ncbi:MAG: IPT/TIG domain-containing protein [Prosthecobacter sp.]|uniref:beta strand repeat-containing protein n=1 Tax=Prosthecobacter sp. TaxID=1965333 RepID=UPI0025CECA0A|nr:IPT/TIG domain-containing protein [Prosthecobacter sp.]MCF7787314.1 IPT/TIG domain-containing protein [Prosthecobacter sp.]